MATFCPVRDANCRGQKCMWYIAVRRGDGTATEGCAVAMATGFDIRSKLAPSEASVIDIQKVDSAFGEKDG